MIAQPGIMRKKPQLFTTSPQQSANKISALHVYIAKTILSRARLEKTIGELQAQVAMARADVARLNAAIDAIANSHSWKLTAPLRKATAWLHRNEEPPIPDEDAQANLGTTIAAESRSYARSSEESISDDFSPFETGGKDAWDRHGQARLRKFLAADEELVFPLYPEPQLSIILVLYNKAHLSLLSLLSLHEHADAAYEVVIVDNNSSDETAELLGRLQNVRVIHNDANVGFAAGCMQGAAEAKGKYLCFLNNDALLQQGALSTALSNFDNPLVGAVGGKILLADGRLQEAGCILWSSGTTDQYGRGDEPQKLEYNFRRPVDYCSGAFLFTPSQLFRELGGFDDRFSMGYWEDSDYCLRVWRAGYRVLYDSRAVIRHYETASAAAVPNTIDYIITNHGKFVDKWKNVLPDYYEPDPENKSAARISVADDRLRILFVDQRVPQPSLGQDARSFGVLRRLSSEGIVACAAFDVSPTHSDRDALDLDIELVDATSDRRSVLIPYLRDADVVWVARESIARELIPMSAETDRCKIEVVVDDGAEHPTERPLPDVLLPSGLPSEQLKAIREEQIVMPFDLAESGASSSAPSAATSREPGMAITLRVVS